MGGRTRSAHTEALERRLLLSLTAVGAEFRVNSTTGNAQEFADAAMDAAGNFVITWESQGQDGSGYGAYAQRFNSAGVPQGSEFRVNTTTAGDQRVPQVAMDSDGDFVITWSGAGASDPAGIYAQRYNAAGVAQGPQFLVNSSTTGDQIDPDVAMSSGGSFVVTWASFHDGGDLDIFMQRYDTSGVAQGGEVPVYLGTPDDQRVPRVACDADGDYVITWASRYEDGSDYGVFARRFNAAGTAQGAAFAVNTYTTSLQIPMGVALDADGDFVISWYGPGPDDAGVHARRYNSSGVPLAGQFRVNTFTTGGQFNGSVAMSPDGRFAIVWESSGQDAGNVYAQAFSAGGAPDGGEFRANTYTTGVQSFPTIAMDADGDVVIVWQSNNQDGSFEGIYAQRYTNPDIVPPAVSFSVLEFQARQAISLTFSEALNPATVSATDLSALNLDNASTPIANSVILSAGNTIATWVFSTSGTFISDGDYQFTLPAGAVSDAAGNALTSPHVLSGASIYFLAGDANRDRQVNLADYNTLAGNYGQSPRNFSQGDFNYDSLVNLADYNLLAARYGLVLAGRQTLTGSSSDREGRSQVSLLGGELD